MNKKFNIAEILESVDSIINENKSTPNIKKTTLEKLKEFNNKKINMNDNPETEKIINDAEKSLEDQNLSSKNQDTHETDIKRKMEKVNIERESVLTEMKSIDELDTLILDNDFVEEDSNESVENNLEVLEEENNLKDLENNLVYINKKLKKENIKKEEKIKDQTILLEKFSSQKRYFDLDKKIKLYQDDNAVLRKKILQLSNMESTLRLQISSLSLDKQDRVQKNESSNNQQIQKNKI
jgi:hypothetical protein